MNRRKHLEDWKKAKEKRIRSYFEGVATVARPKTVEGGEEMPIKIPSPDDRPKSPLPDLVIEKVQRRNYHDEPEEFYEMLQITVQTYIDRLKRGGSCESRTTHLSSFSAVLDDDIRSSLLASSCGSNIDQVTESDKSNCEIDRNSKESKPEEISLDDCDIPSEGDNHHKSHTQSTDDSDCLDNNERNYHYYKLYFSESNDEATKNKSKDTSDVITEQRTRNEDDVEEDEMFPAEIKSPILRDRKNLFEKTGSSIRNTFASRQEDRGRPDVMRRQQSNTSVDSFNEISAGADKRCKETFENIAYRAFTPETESITFTPEARTIRISSLYHCGSPSSSNSPSPSIQGIAPATESTALETSCRQHPTSLFYTKVASRQEDRGRSYVMRKQQSITSVESFNEMSPGTNKSCNKKFENIAVRALTPETEGITFTSDTRSIRMSCINFSGSTSGSNSPPPKRRRIEFETFTVASRQGDRGRPDVMRAQQSNTSVDSFNEMSDGTDKTAKEKFENIAERAFTPETESITFTPETRLIRISSLHLRGSTSSLNSPSPPKRERISRGVQTNLIATGRNSVDRSVQTSGDLNTLKISRGVQTTGPNRQDRSEQTSEENRTVYFYGKLNFFLN